VTDQEGLTTLLSHKEYDPGTKLQATDKPDSDNDSFVFQNKVSDIFQAYVFFQAKYFLSAILIFYINMIARYFEALLCTDQARLFLRTS
jgi:hypothetical protein